MQESFNFLSCGCCDFSLHPALSHPNAATTRRHATHPPTIRARQTPKKNCGVAHDLFLLSCCSGKWGFSKVRHGEDDRTPADAVLYSALQHSRPSLALLLKLQRHHPFSMNTASSSSPRRSAAALGGSSRHHVLPFLPGTPRVQSGERRVFVCRFTSRPVAFTE